MIFNLWNLHHDEDFWGDPYTFRPDRFLDDDGQLLSASHENRRHLMPFGAGMRVCMGEILAISRIFLIVATIAQIFEAEQGDLKSSCDPRDYPEDYEILLNVRNDHQLLE